MEKKYKEVNFHCGWTIESAVEELLEKAKSGDLYYGEFNGCTLYSDTVTLDSAYKEITGKSYSEFIKEQRKWREDMERQDKEYQKAIPQLTKEWIDKGHKILDKEYWTDWDECVPIRLSGLYQGMELRCCLHIVEELNNGCSLSEAKDIINDQGHSGMSYGLVRSIVKAFCNRGTDFAEYVN